MIRWENAVEKEGQTFDLIATYRREWTCPVHDRPWYPDDEEYDDEIVWNFRPYGCRCEHGAEWVTTDDLVFHLEGTLTKILKAFYLPTIRDQLSNTILLDRLMEERG